MKSTSVFSDPSGRRRRLVNVCIAISVFSAVAIAVLSYLGLVYAPRLLQGGQIHRAPEVLVDVKREPQKTHGELPLDTAAVRALPPKAADVPRIAFFDVNDVSSHFALQARATSLDAIFGNFLELDEKKRALSRTSGEREDRLRRRLHGLAPALKIYPILSSQLSAIETGALLASSAVRAQIIESVKRYLHDNDDAGIVLDLNELPPASFGYVLDLIYGFAKAIHPEGRKVVVSGGMATNRSQRQQLGHSADLVITQTGDLTDLPLHGGAPNAQPVFETTLREYTETIDPRKLIVTLGAYACDSSRADAHKITSVGTAFHLMKRAGSSMSFDPKALNARFTYADGLGRVHDVWILDGVSLFNQAKVALGARPAGIALWRLGYEDPSVWSVFAKGRIPGSAALEELKVLPGGWRFDDATTSQIITAAQGGSSGSRTISYREDLGLIVNETVSRLPDPQTFDKWDPPDRNLLAITFDDGPDERNTGKILDILAEKNVHATFFVIGRNALQSPALLKRIYAEGHDIGNHTFSHPLLSDVPLWQMNYELNATQRVFEFLLGIDSHLFRPPYNGARLMSHPDHATVLAEASRLGYTTVLSGVHAWDWLNPKPEVIYQRIVKGIIEGDGQIILLHDWGQRSATVAALPHIIDGLRAKGFRFGTVHELLGLDRSLVMPSSTLGSVSPQGEIEGGYVGIVAYQVLAYFITILAVIVIVLNLARVLFAVVGTYCHKRLERKRAGHAYWPSSVAVIVPAFNEEKVICKTITSILNSSRNDIEVVLVDDGSSDNTVAVAQAAFFDDPRVRIFTKPNGGKADASNFALQHTQAEVVIAIDADGVLEPRAIELLVRHFDDPEVGAVAGTAIVGNGTKLLTRFQALEYLVGQYLDRRALTLFNANSVVPGAIGAWRREALLSVGGYATDTVAEDCDATFALIRAGWKVLYEPSAEARTEAPETLRGLLKQRRRWMFGMLQVVTKNWAAVRGGPRGLGWLTIPHVLVFGFFISLSTPLLGAAFLYQVGSHTAAWQLSTDPTSVDEISVYLKWWMILSVVDLVLITSVLNFAGIKDIFRQTPLIVLQRVIYLPIIYWLAFETVFAALKGKIVAWNKLNRTGSVSMRPGPAESN